MITRIHNADCHQEYLTAFGLDPARVIYFDIETTGFRASTSRLYMIGWAVQENAAGKDRSDCPDDRLHNCSSERQPECPTEHLHDCPGSDCSESVPGRSDSAPHPSEDGRHWVVTQIMAESSAEEVLLLRQFEKILSLYDTIIEFNGDRFDLPYMKEKYASYNLSDPFVHCKTVDLYREIKPYKNALGLSRLNQKSVETFLHITRDDPYNGGELIDVYRSFRNHTCEDEESAVNALFLHNYEDVLGMLKMTPLLSYHLAMHSAAPVTVYPVEGSSKGPGYQTIEAGFDLDVPVPVSVRLDLGKKIQDYLADPPSDFVGYLQGREQNMNREASNRDKLQDQQGSQDWTGLPEQHCVQDQQNLQNQQSPQDQQNLQDWKCLQEQDDLPAAACSITFSENRAVIRLCLFPLRLYHYFPDYRNYYYLPEEDTAIHKSVASFVDASHREKAKAQNCYIKKCGLFLPQAEERYQPAFRRFYKDSVSWFEYRQELMEDSDEVSAYFHSLILSAASVKE